MAALRVRFTHRARKDLREILGFIAEDNPDAAERLSHRVEEGLLRVAQFPESARRIPEALERRERDLVIPPLRLFYRVEGEVLWVMMAIRAEREFRAEDLG